MTSMTSTSIQFKTKRTKTWQGILIWMYLIGSTAKRATDFSSEMNYLSPSLVSIREKNWWLKLRAWIALIKIQGGAGVAGWAEIAASITRASCYHGSNSCVQLWPIWNQHQYKKHNARRRDRESWFECFWLEARQREKPTFQQLQEIIWIPALSVSEKRIDGYNFEHE